MSVCEITMSFPSRVSPLDRFQPNVIILKTAVSHRGTETTEAPDKELYRRKALKNCHPLGGDTASENPPFHLLCALLKLSHSFNSVAISTVGFRIIIDNRAFFVVNQTCQSGQVVSQGNCLTSLGKR